MKDLFFLNEISRDTHIRDDITTAAAFLQNFSPPTLSLLFVFSYAWSTDFIKQ